MKNAHGVEPNRYMKREESKYAIECDYRYGPRFNCHRESLGHPFFTTINRYLYIDNLRNREPQCYIHNDGTKEYEFHPQYRYSLFVNTSGPDERNSFSILDYEVYTH